MNTSTDMTIEQQLRRTWKRERRFCHMRGFCRFVIWAVMLLLLGLLIDWGLLHKNRMPSAISPLLGVVGLATMLWVLWRDWLRHLRPYDATRIAVEVESKYPELMSSLVTYTQMDAISNQTEASPELLEAMRGFAVQQAVQLKFSDIIDFSQLKKLAAYALIVLVVAAGVSVRWSDYVGVLVQRLAGVDTSYPILTTIHSIDGDRVVPFGQTVTLKVKAAGVIPSGATLHVRPAEGASGAWSELPMERLASGISFSRDLESLERDMEYFVTLGDSRSKAFRITVVRSPQIVEVEVQLHYPSYLSRPPETTDQLNLEVPEGTRIEWWLRCDKEVRKLDVVYGDDRLEAEVSKSGQNVSFSMTAKQNTTYAFEWTEGESGKSYQFQDVEYSIKSNQDAKPRIVLSAGAPHGPATLGKRAEISWKAKDDHGLGKIWLVYAVIPPGETEPLEGSQQRILLQDAKGGLSNENSHTWVLAKDVPDLKPGMKIRYSLETSDLKPVEKEELDVKEDRVTTSQPSREIEIYSNEGYIQWYRSQLAKHNAIVKKTFLAERDASEQIKQLLSDQGDDQK